MKSIVLGIIIGCFAATAIWAGPPTQDTVGAVSVKVIPAQNISGAPAWATNTIYTQGETVTVGGYYYMVVVAGTSTTVYPTHKIGEPDEVAGGVTWRCFSSRKRLGFVVFNQSTNVMYTSVGYPAIAGHGWAIAAGGGQYFDGDSQGAVYAVYDTGLTGIIGAQSWEQ
jgi:hypothetical protein